MNWNLIVRLSFFGFLMGAVSVMGVSLFLTTILWLVIYSVSVVTLAKQCTGKYFLNGFILSMLNIGWTTGFHVIFYKSYLAANPEMDLLYSMLPFSESPRLGIIFIAPVFGAFFGLLTGFFSFLIAKVMGK